MGYAAAAMAIIAAVGEVVGGLSAAEQSKADARRRQVEAAREASITGAELEAEIGAEVAKAGGAGTSLAGGSNVNIFTASALNKANTISDIRFAGAVDAANLRQQAKNQKITGIFLGAGKALGGIRDAQYKKKQIADKKKTVTPNKPTPPPAPPSGGSSKKSLLKK